MPAFRAVAEESEPAKIPDFKEVSGLIKDHLTGESDADLNRDSVQGLLHELHGRAILISSNGVAESNTTNAALVENSRVFDDSTGYVRVGNVGKGLATAVTTAWQNLGASNKLNGLVLDLRFAKGADYAEAAAVADLFLTNSKPLLDWGDGVMPSTDKTNALTMPVAILVNSQTSGAAEALAAVLRLDDRAVLLGFNTAGVASITKDFPLKDGGYLRLATSSIKLGTGDVIPPQGVKPDILVNVKPEIERAYIENPFRENVGESSLLAGLMGEPEDAAGKTNHPARVVVNEAELMRQRREKPGVDLDELPWDSIKPSAADARAERPVVHDPVLGRALDLIKGIAAIEKSRSS
jgi:hypothetical protein